MAGVSPSTSILSNSISNNLSFNTILPGDAQLNSIHDIYLALGLFITLFGFYSLVLKDKLFLSEAFAATVFGIILNVSGLTQGLPTGAASSNQTTLEFARVVLGIQCLAAGIQSPGSFVLREWRSLSMLLGPVMIAMWLVSTAIIYGVLGVDIIDALVIAACITPTDPVLANSIVKGKFADQHIPRHLRNLLAAESAANDGLGLPFLLFPIYISKNYITGYQGFGYWILNSILYQIGVSIILGTILGIGARKLLKKAQSAQWTDNESILGFSVASALAVIGLFSRLGIDEILGCFVVGLAISWDEWFNRQIEESHIQEVLDSLLNITFFVYVGARIPWTAMVNLPIGMEFWRLIVACVLIILFRRLPIVLLLKPMIPALANWMEAVFCGWFGPIGAGAIFYSALAIEELGIPEEPILSIVSLVVVSSILLHGSSVGLFHIGLTRQRTMEQRSRIVRVDHNRRPPIPAMSETTHHPVTPNSVRTADDERTAETLEVLESVTLESVKIDKETLPPASDSDKEVFNSP